MYCDVSTQFKMHWKTQIVGFPQTGDILLLKWWYPRINSPMVWWYVRPSPGTTVCGCLTTGRSAWTGDAWTEILYTGTRVDDVDDLVGGWPTPLKNMSSSVGMIIPNIWKKMFQTTNQWCICSECRDSVNLESKPLDISDISWNITHNMRIEAAKMGGDMLMGCDGSNQSSHSSSLAVENHVIIAEYSPNYIWCVL